MFTLGLLIKEEEKSSFGGEANGTISVGMAGDDSMV